MGEFRIETDRLVLREWREADAEALLPMEQDARVMRFLGPLGDEAEARRIVVRQIANQRMFGHCFWAIERHFDGAFLGFCGVQRGPAGTPISGDIEIGWRLREDAWGQGYAREAATASLAWGWANLPAARIVAITVAANVPSWRLMERIGMIRRPDLDFPDPLFPDGHPLRALVTYAIARPAGA